MKPIDKHELYECLSNFLRSKGVDLREGVYTARIQKGCSLVAEVVNTGQETLGRAKGELDKTLDQFRQTIHETTAPREPKEPPAPPPARPAEPDHPGLQALDRAKSEIDKALDHFRKTVHENTSSRESREPARTQPKDAAESPEVAVQAKSNATATPPG